MEPHRQYLVRLMGHSAIPAVIDALVERATAALPDINVYDGFGIPGDLDGTR